MMVRKRRKDSSAPRVVLELDDIYSTKPTNSWFHLPLSTSLTKDEKPPWMFL